MHPRSFVSFAALCALGSLAAAPGASAQAPAPAPTDQAAPAAPAAAPSTAINLPYGFSMTGHVELGANVNPDDPTNNTNFGQAFMDRSDTFRMNQLMVNVEKDLDPKNADWQWGAKFTGMYGTDARVTHFMNEFDRSISGPYQFDIVELDVQAHAPTIGGGTDIKFGQYPTPLGAEVIDATGNTFFSHSYIFQFGLPFKHTGILTTTHVNDTIDAWLGLDTGMTTPSAPREWPTISSRRSSAASASTTSWTGTFRFWRWRMSGPRRRGSSSSPTRSPTKRLAEHLPRRPPAVLAAASSPAPTPGCANTSTSSALTSGATRSISSTRSTSSTTISPRPLAAAWRST